MNAPVEQATQSLTHALTFVREAKTAKYPELLAQHLNEADRLIEYALGILKEPHGISE